MFYWPKSIRVQEEMDFIGATRIRIFHRSRFLPGLQFTRTPTHSIGIILLLSQYLHWREENTHSANIPSAQLTVYANAINNNHTSSSRCIPCTVLCSLSRLGQCSLTFLHLLITMTRIQVTSVTTTTAAVVLCLSLEIRSMTRICSKQRH